MKVKWSKVVSQAGDARDVAWAAIVDGAEVALIFKGGASGYPWSTNMPGYKIHNASTLAIAKESVEAALEATVR